MVWCLDIDAVAQKIVKISLTITLFNDPPKQTPALRVAAVHVGPALNQKFEDFKINTP